MKRLVLVISILLQAGAPCWLKVWADPYFFAITNNTINAPAVTTFHAAATPGVITGSTPTGDADYNYQWQSSTDNLNFTDLPGATGRDLNDPPLLTQTTYFHRLVSSGTFPAPVISNIVKITFSIPITGNFVSAPRTTSFCVNGDADIISGNKPSGGTGRYSFQWQSSADSSNFMPVMGTNTLSFDPPLANETTWYRRQVFSGCPGAAATTLATNNIDVFLIGGQSNAIGLGDRLLQPLIPEGICWKYENGAFTQVTTQPIGSAKSGSAWPAFAIAYYNKTGRKVCFIPAAVGATRQVSLAGDSSNNWDLTGTLVDRSISLLNDGLAAAASAGLTPVLRGILWDQGERDANNVTSGSVTVGQYQVALQNMIASYRTKLAVSNLPFYIFRISNHGRGGIAVQNAQESVANADVNTLVVFREAIDFTIANGYINPEGIHYTQPGYNLMGQIGGDIVGACSMPVTSNIIKIAILNPGIPLLAADTVQICTGNTATFTVATPGEGITYNWYDSPAGTNLLASGTSFVTGVLNTNRAFYVNATSGSCTSPVFTIANVVVNDIPAAPQIAQTSPSLCSGSGLTLTINNPQAGLTYNWYTGVTEGIPVFTGVSFATPPLSTNITYYVDAVNRGGCASLTRAAISVNVNSSPQVTAQGTAICPGTSAVITAKSDNPNAIVNWYADATGGSILFTGTTFKTPVLNANSIYFAEAIDNSTGCFSVTRSAAPVEMLQPLATPVVVAGNTTTSSVSFVWSAVPGATGYQVSIDNGQTFINPSSGKDGLTHMITGLQFQQRVTIIVRATGGAPCELSDNSAAVTAVAVTDLSGGIFVANAFTPNSDGKNDRVYVRGESIKSLKFNIYGQQGELIYTSNSQQDGWDGTYKGTREPVRVYVYSLEAIMNNGQKVNKKGTITLLR